MRETNAVLPEYCIARVSESPLCSLSEKEVTIMSIIASIEVALFLMVVVFLVLFGICLCIKFFSFLINKIESHLKHKNQSITKN